MTDTVVSLELTTYRSAAPGFTTEKNGPLPTESAANVHVCKNSIGARVNYRDVASRFVNYKEACPVWSDRALLRAVPNQNSARYDPIAVSITETVDSPPLET
jgi:hypothetical protein